MIGCGSWNLTRANCRANLRARARPLIDIDTALEECGILIPLVDHDVFRVIPAEERAHALVYDTRGIWPDQPATVATPPALRLAK